MTFSSPLLRATPAALRHLSAASTRPGTVFAARRFQHTLKDSYEYITVEKRDGGVGLITLNRPKALNALCDDLFNDLVHAGKALDTDNDIGCMVLTGSTKAFAAGADISEMKDRTFDHAYQTVRAAYIRKCFV
jgi:1,4-dihydroxy-2-naphthoyl-CoA synthase